MPELRDKQLPHFTPAGPEINIHAIPFKDKARETARQKRLAAELAAGGKNAKQIKAEQRAAERIAKQKERRATEIAKGRNPNKKRGKQQRIFDEWDELAKEERLYKKLRTKKISKEEYDRLMYGDNQKGDEDEDGDDDSDWYKLIWSDNGRHYISCLWSLSPYRPLGHTYDQEAVCADR